jgi:hypothetical protein
LRSKECFNAVQESEPQTNSICRLSSQKSWGLGDLGRYPRNLAIDDLSSEEVPAADLSIRQPETPHDLVMCRELAHHDGSRFSPEEDRQGAIEEHLRATV